MDLVGTIISVVAGLFGGAVGGVLTAASIARNGEKARVRFEAEEAIRASATAYRATMVFDHEELYENSQYSQEYGNVAGQEAFASEILVQLPHIPAKTSEKVKAELRLLLGDLTYNLAAQRAFVPVERFDDDREGQRQSLVLDQILSTDEARIEGVLRRMLATQNRGDSHHELFEAAIAALDRMLAALADKRWRFWRRL